MGEEAASSSRASGDVNMESAAGMGNCSSTTTTVCSQTKCQEHGVEKTQSL